MKFLNSIQTVWQMICSATQGTPPLQVTSTTKVDNLNAEFGTNLMGGSNGTIPYQTDVNATAMLSTGTSGQVLKSNGVSAPSWQTLDMTYLPDSTFKKSVRCATTTNITLSGTQTIDGISLVVGDRVLVKNQTTSNQNGIYTVSSDSWTRTPDADSITKLASGLVAVDSGTVNGGFLFDNDLKITDTLGTTNIIWNASADNGKKLNFFSSTTSSELASVISDETGSGSLVFASTPALTGTPTAPTATKSTNTTQIATTAFVMGQLPTGFGRGSGTNSTIDGSSTTAIGNNSHSEGIQTTANGVNSHSEGSYTTANGQSSHAEGDSNIVTNDYAHVEGRNNGVIYGTTYAITSYSGQVLTLASTPSYSVNDIIYVFINNVKPTALTVTAISTNLVTVSGGTPSNTWKYVVKPVQSYYSVSHAEGYNTFSTGTASHSAGYMTFAIADYSHSEGRDSIASGVYSHAEGSSTIASGNASHSEGNYTTASASYSHSEGNYTTASASYSHAEGNYTTANAQYSHAEGNYSAVIEGTSIAISSYSGQVLTLASTPSYSVNDIIYVFIGSSKAIPLTVTAISTNLVTVSGGTPASAWKYVVKSTTNNSTGSHVEGYNNLVTGQASHAEGYMTVANGNYSHAEGFNSIANGTYSHAENYATASGSCSHAEGNTVASGSYSHAQGATTTASGNCSHAEGNYTTATTYLSHTMGQYNKALTGNATTYSGTADALVVGNGTTAVALGNAFRVTFAGATYGLSAFNSTGADYAEYFEWLDKNPNSEDRVGYFVTLDGEKIRKANSTDNYILGIVSASPSVIGDSYNDDWNEKYITDDWGRTQYQDVVIPTTYKNVHHESVYNDVLIEAILDEQGNIVTPEHYEHQLVTEGYDEQVVDVEEHTDNIPILNPNWDSTKEYIPREKRPEWSAIGMMGKLLVRDDGTCVINGYCKPNDDGIATTSEKGYRVMKRLPLSSNIIQVLIK
jgi:trimeric autotransporter adhesin